MRRSDREITDRNEILQVMERCDVCRLALNDGEYHASLYSLVPTSKFIPLLLTRWLPSSKQNHYK